MARCSVGHGYKSGNLGNELIEELIKAHLVRRELHAGSPWYELAHDQLIIPVLKDNEIWFGEHLNKVQQRAAQWAKENEPWALLLAGKDLEEAERWEKQNWASSQMAGKAFPGCLPRATQKKAAGTSRFDGPDLPPVRDFGIGVPGVARTEAR